MFTGEINLLSGRRAFAETRVSASGEIIEVERSVLLSLIQADGELSEILLRAFILRRVDLIARGFGDVVMIGSNHCASTLRVRESRPPFLLETSLPGVFAAGDVRSGNVKRVASAVGEGSIAVSFVHRVLRE